MVPKSPKGSLTPAIAGYHEMLPKKGEHAKESKSFDRLAGKQEVKAMQVLYERCGGLDVHKKSVTVCVITPEGKETRTFLTMTRGLMEMVSWLEEKGVAAVAMESTGTYWKPIYNLLEENGINPWWSTPATSKTCPAARPTSRMPTELLQHGLLRESFIPPRDQRELRELLRYRRSLIEEQSREINRIQKVLEGAGIKLGDVATDGHGKSGKKILEALAQGETDPEKLADLACGRLKNKHHQLVEAPRGIMGPHQRLMLSSLIRHIDFLAQEIARLDQEIEDRMRPFSEALERIDQIPGIGRRAAEEILGEIGVDMSRFPTGAHLASWAGNNESAGKRLSGKTTRGNTHLGRPGAGSSFGRADQGDLPIVPLPPARTPPGYQPGCRGPCDPRDHLPHA